MSDGLHVEIRDDEIRGAMQRVAQALEHPQPLLEIIGAVLERNVVIRFQSETDPDGNAWLPLAERTRKAYEKKYDGNIPGSLLLRTAEMFGSLAHNATDEYVEVGFSDVKASYHETGTWRMPRRSMLFGDFVAGTLGAGDQADVLAEVNDYLGSLLA